MTEQFCILIVDDEPKNVQLLGILLQQSGYAIEFAGSAIRGLSMEGRMTLCNMAIEAGARAGMVAVDDTTINYVKGRPYAPKAEQWDAAVAYWRTLHSDEGAQFDAVVELDATAIQPQVTWGTSPEMVTSIDGVVPDPAKENDPTKRGGIERRERQGHRDFEFARQLFGHAR